MVSRPLDAGSRPVEEAAATSCIATAISRITRHLPAELKHLRKEDLAREMGWLRDACAFGRYEPASNGAIAALRRLLVDTVRHEVVAMWEQDPPDRGSMLDTLVRLEAAHAACVTRSEHTLAAELADQGGLNLMVEVAHDMRSPLTSIVFLSEVLHKGQSGPLTPVQRRQLGIIYSAALGLAGLASDLIEMSRQGRRRKNAQPAPFAVNGVLTSVHDLVRPMVEEKGLIFTLDPLSADRRYGHPVELSRILLNLTANALKFTHEGGVTLAARAMSGNVVEFSVTDTGPGIPDDEADSIYQPFRHEPKRETGYAFSGTGLGLAICRRLVAHMGSELKVDTGPQGTRFAFALDLPPASTV
jgi:signal transduction histidine kinase